MMRLVRTASAVQGEPGFRFSGAINQQAPLHCPPICPLTVHSSVLGSGSQLRLAQNVFPKRSRCETVFCVKAQI